MQATKIPVMANANPLVFEKYDVTDRKYVVSGQDGGQRASSDRLEQMTKWPVTLRTFATGVSYNTEKKDPAAAQLLLQRYPELAIVQDADRLDVIGAVGIGRVFISGGAKTDRSLDESVSHFDQKLLYLEGMMKTAAGAAMARERTERLRIFKSWWEDEACGRLYRR